MHPRLDARRPQDWLLPGLLLVTLLAVPDVAFAADVHWGDSEETVASAGLTDSRGRIRLRLGRTRGFAVPHFDESGALDEVTFEFEDVNFAYPKDRLPFVAALVSTFGPVTRVTARGFSMCEGRVVLTHDYEAEVVRIVERRGEGPCRPEAPEDGRVLGVGLGDAYAAAVRAGRSLSRADGAAGLSGVLRHNREREKLEKRDRFLIVNGSVMAGCGVALGVFGAAFVSGFLAEFFIPPGIGFLVGGAAQIIGGAADLRRLNRPQGLALGRPGRRTVYLLAAPTAGGAAIWLRW